MTTVIEDKKSDFVILFFLSNPIKICLALYLRLSLLRDKGIYSNVVKHFDLNTKCKKRIRKASN